MELRKDYKQKEEYQLSNKFGIIISLEKYIDSAVGLSDVEYANADAASIKDIFVRKIGVAEENILVLNNEKCTVANCKSGDLAYYMTRLEEDTTVYLYYVGHGYFCNGKNYLTAYDTSTLDLVETSISFNDVFMEQFRRSRANRLIAFIDACAEWSGDNERSINCRGFDFSGFDGMVTFDYAAFFSCSPKEKSYSSDKLKHGIWTYFLNKAISENAMEALSKDGTITANSLKEYLKSEVAKYARNELGKNQTPYAVIASNSELLILGSDDEHESFEEVILRFDEELNNKCYLANIILNDYEEDFVFDNYAIMEEICWDIDTASGLPEGWHDAFNSLMFYANRVKAGKKIELPFFEKKEEEIKIKTFLNALNIKEDF
ncbi:MAG: caspase family protein [Acetatifactor sp.]|nr:caspase family protein [Acetatifactor sp.]